MARTDPAEWRTVLPVVALVVLAGCTGMGNSVAGGGGNGAMGYAAGGAQDANAFRTNVEEGYVPQPTDVTYEGLFHDYYFETGRAGDCEALFCPTYSAAVTRDPLSNETERYLTVGLNSGISEAEFERPRLNLVVVVDTSDSMSGGFGEYYYDDGERHTVESDTSKMNAATDAVAAMTRHLHPEDRIGVVAFDDDAEVVRPLRAVNRTDRESLRADVDDLRAGGGTNLAAGRDLAREMLAPYAEPDRRNVETRIVYVTDAMPNLGTTDEDGLSGALRSDAEAGIHSTFVGVGVDFNTRLTEAISSVRGANYYAVRSPAEFEDRMVEGFDHMVSPMVFDLSVRVESGGYGIEAVYGSPDAEASTGRLMHVPTLFPARTEDNRTEGGVVLVELNRTGPGDGLTLVASYETRGGESRSVTREVTVPDRDPPYYETSGVRKAVALSRYATLLRNWAAHERALAAGEGTPTPAEGIEHRTLGQWEQRSVDLAVSPPYGERFAAFEAYFRAEMRALGDDSMGRDLAVVERLVRVGTGTETVPATGTADPGTGSTPGNATGTG